MDDTLGQPTTDAPGPSTPSHPARSIQRRITFLAVLVGLCALAYGLMVALFGPSDRPVEAQLGKALGNGIATIYLHPLRVDPVNSSLQIRISMVPAAIAGAPAAIGDRNRSLVIQSGNQVEHVAITVGQPLPEVVFDFDLSDGDVRDYPLDEYRTSMTLAVSETGADGKETALPIHVTLWEGLLGFRVRGRAEPAQGKEAVGLQLDIRRSGAVSIFGIAVYVAMAAIAICGLLIGGLVFAGVRRVEVTFAGALGAIIFAVPALRAALPGTPPLGIRADVLIFFCAEFGATIALCLFVAAWIRSGARP